jgi:hypothetical protein
VGGKWANMPHSLPYLKRWQDSTIEIYGRFSFLENKLNHIMNFLAMNFNFSIVRDKNSHYTL